MSKIIQFKPRLGSSQIRKRLGMPPSGLDNEAWVSIHEAVRRVISAALEEAAKNGKA
jgi:hypothetical protein